MPVKTFFQLLADLMLWNHNTRSVLSNQDAIWVLCMQGCGWQDMDTQVAHIMNLSM